MAGPPAKFGTGGMVTKLDAGSVAQRHGAATVIAPGRTPGVLARIFAGVRQVDGDFGPGDPVDVKDQSGAVVARGLATLGARETRRVAGMMTADAQRAFGEPIPDELIHKDDLVLL